MTGISWFRVGAVAAFLGVAAGAFLAHGLEDMLKRMGETDGAGAVPLARRLEVFETGVKYQMYHAFGLLALGLLAGRGTPGGLATAAGWAFLAGIVLFSGSLYGITFTGLKWLGMITPVGGLGFLVGWLALAAASWPKGAGSP